MCWRLPALLCFLSIAAAIASVPAESAVLTVRQDGTGGFTTVSGALAAASSGDTIDVGAGTYPELLDVTKRLAFVGAGAGASVLEGEAAHQILVFRAGSSGSTVEGFSLTNAYGGNGGALRVQDSCSVSVKSCALTNNYAAYDGAAFFVRHATSHLLLEDCEFEGNYSAHNGGAGNIIESGTLDVNRCSFRNNGTDVVSGALAAHYATMRVSDCLFSWNGSADVAGAVYYYQSAGFVRDCTFDRNAASGSNAATVLIQSSGSVTFERNIVSNTRVGTGFAALLCSPAHTCNLFWNNAGGSWGGDATTGAGEMEADPLYCGESDGDYTIAYESPAAPANNGCGTLIGAFDPACHEEEEPPHVCERLAVRQDGTGDFTSVGAALAAAYGCDTIDVGPGIYRETLDVTKAIVFIGAGAASTVFDGEGARTLMTFRFGSSGASVSGCAFVNAHGSNGGALRVQDGCDVAVRECSFADNVADYDGAAFFVRNEHSHLRLESCAFDRNSSIHNGGAGNIIDNGLLEIDGCVFRNNSTAVVSGALAAHRAEMRVTRSLFVGNASGDVAGAIYFFDSKGYVQNCTFDHNAAPGVKAGTVFVHESPAVFVERCILANAPDGAGLWIGEWAFGTHTCNLFFANVEGDVGGGTALDPTETIGNPSFCDPAAGDYRIAFESPGAPEHNPCGVIIGAYSRGCHEGPIATLLQRFEAKRRDWTIVVSWSILAGAGEPSFSIERAVDAATFEPVEGMAVSRHGTDYAFSDGDVEPGRTYRYRISYALDAASGLLFETEHIAMPEMPLTLFQNVPNPFNPSTAIRFYLPEASKVVLDVYDASGRRIASLLDARCAAGMHVIPWTGSETRGGPAASGIYFYRLKTDAGVLSRKMILLR